MLVFVHRVLAAVVACAGVSAQAPTLVADINRQPDPAVRSSHPEFLGTAGGRLFFAAADFEGARQLWSTLGSPGTTVPAGVIYPLGDANPRSLLEHAGFAYFTAEDGVHGAELWRSDGSTSGTALVHDLMPGPDNSGAMPVASLGPWLFVVDTQGGQNLWVTDGSSAAMRRVAGVAHPGPFLVANGRCWFLAPGTLGPGLWSSDGTAETLIANLSVPVVRNATLVAAGQRVFFTVDSDLWVSDGTAAGTARITPTSMTSPYALTPFGADVLLFAIANGTLSLWRSDGTATGTIALTAASSLGSHAPQRLGNLVVFQARTAAGLELWRSDGTVAGTRFFADVTPGAADTNISAWAAAGGELRFAVDGPQPALWRTDGTAAGTRKIVDLTARVRTLMSVPGTAISAFAHESPGLGVEPWRTDGTTNGTWLLGDVTPNPRSVSSYPREGVDLFGELLFAADDGVRGPELWRTNGTTAGTQLVADIVPGSAGSSPQGFTIAGQRAFFLATDGTPYRFGLHATDGRTVQAVALPDPVMPGGPALAELLPGVVVCVTSSAAGSQVWRTDGTPGGTQLLLGGLPPSVLQQVVVLGSRRGRALALIEGWNWNVTVVSTDGTPAGSSVLGRSIGASRGVGWIRDRGYFLTAEGLWRSDGTLAGTTLFPMSVADFELVGDDLFLSTGR